MAKKEKTCVVCNGDFLKQEEKFQASCIICDKEYEWIYKCKAGHAICPECYEERSLEKIRIQCFEIKSKNPIEILEFFMNDPFIHTHSRIHHIIVGLSLALAYKNNGGNVNIEQDLAQIIERGKLVPGGICGNWGCCGAAVGCGIFASVISGAKPKEVQGFGFSNIMTSRALNEIGIIGGPRCCKRNSYLSILASVNLVKEHFDINMDMPEKIICHYADKNKECIGKKCPFNMRGNAE